MNYKACVFVVFLVFGFFKMNAQNDVDLASDSKGTYLKGNAVTLLAAMPHIGLETGLSKKWTFQIDAIASFWDSVDGAPLQFLIVTPEFRYYFKERFKGFYVGGHIAGTTFKLSKFFRGNNGYEQGFGYTAGATIGIQKRLSDRFNIDIFLGGGTHQAFYKGYNKASGERVDGVVRYNKSGEWLPYRGGVMLAYKLN